MYIVYILLSEKDQTKYYVGFTNRLDQRLREHNSGNSRYSKRYAPWKVKAYVAFEDFEKATAFEKYLKSGSGFAFLKKMLI